MSPARTGREQKLSPRESFWRSCRSRARQVHQGRHGCDLVPIFPGEAISLSLGDCRTSGTEGSTKAGPHPIVDNRSGRPRDCIHFLNRQPTNAVEFLLLSRLFLYIIIAPADGQTWAMLMNTKRAYRAKYIRPKVQASPVKAAATAILLLKQASNSSETASRPCCSVTCEPAPT